jgi:hypothetical protein
MSFLAPWLLGGLALASAPIIIHLLNRRRFIVVDWAPMHYLKLTLRTNRRRLRLEQWLLLLVRTLIIIALFLAVARPIISGAGGLGALFGGQGRTSRIIVIDDTLSTAARVGGQSAFDRATDAAAQLIRKIGTQDSITVVTATAPGSPLVRNAHLDDPEPLLDDIEALRPTHAAAPWPAVFTAIDEENLPGAFPVREVTLITDLRAEGWGAEITDQARAWAEAGVALRILDVGATPAGNVALTELAARDAVALVDAPFELRARIRAEGDAQPATDQAILTVDDQPRPIRLPDLAAGQTHELTITQTFTEPGEHTVTLTLPDDALPEDNRRSLVVHVKRELDVMLVDGEPGAAAFESETDFLRLALSVGRAPWRIERLIDSEWLGSPLTAPDVLVLANVATLTEARAAELDQMVRAGLGLIIFPGDQLDPAVWNATLHRGGKGPLPAAIDAVIETEARGMLVEAVDDSPIARLGELSPRVLGAIAPRRVLALRPIERGATAAEEEHLPRILARWDGPDRHPAIIEKRHGKGRVLLLTVTADKAWSDWPTDPSYVLAVREAAERLAVTGGGGGGAIEAGQPIVQPVDATRPPTRATVTPPGAPEPIAAAIDRLDPQAVAVRHEATRTAGLYRLTWDVPGAGDQTRRVAVNPSTAESDLTPIAHDRLRELLAPLEVSIVALGSGELSLVGNQVELWRTAAFALLAFVLFESLLAAWVGRER